LERRFNTDAMMNTVYKKLNNKPKKRKRVFIALLSVFLITINIPFPVNFTTTAIEIIQTDPSHSIEHTVTVRGWYSTRIFSSHNEFRGSVTVSGYPETFLEMDGLQFHRFIGNSNFRLADIFYLGELGEKPRRPPFGIMFAERGSFLKGSLIMVFENGLGDTHYSPIIVVGATNQEEALNAIRTMERTTGLSY